MIVSSHRRDNWTENGINTLLASNFSQIDNLRPIDPFTEYIRRFIVICGVSHRGIIVLLDFRLFSFVVVVGIAPNGAVGLIVLISSR